MRHEEGGAVAERPLAPRLAGSACARRARPRSQASTPASARNAPAAPSQTSAAPPNASAPVPAISVPSSSASMPRNASSPIVKASRKRIQRASTPRSHGSQSIPIATGITPT